jgi:diadenosine tetraphosphate (Ap4A) HIT family hydrolase
MKFTEQVVQFRSTGDAEFPYEAVVGDRRWLLRLNDFPAEPLYTLLIDGREAQDLEEWPAAWQRPAE